MNFDQLFHRFPSLVTTTCAAIVAFATVFLLLFYLVFPHYSPQVSPDHILMPPSSSSASFDPRAEMQSTAAAGWVVGLAGVVSVVLLGVIGYSLYGHFHSLKLKRDDRRKQDLQRLQRGLQAYKAHHGHFPLSSTYRPEYYTGINLSKDWHYYGLPSDEQMRQFIPEWPISDPAIDFHGNSQTNQYLYYPRDEGQSFDLYAHLEVPEGQVEDYNTLDNLLRSWGSYNYKVSSQSGGLAPVESSSPQPVAATGIESMPDLMATPQPTEAVASPEVAEVPPLVNQTPARAESLDTQSINDELNFLADEVVASPRPELPEVVRAPGQTAIDSPSSQIQQMSAAMEVKQQVATEHGWSDDPTNTD